jgi:hypothetical protein
VRRLAEPQRGQRSPPGAQGMMTAVRNHATSTPARIANTVATGGIRRRLGHLGPRPRFFVHTRIVRSRKSRTSADSGWAR